jgi:hypothetical protein
MAYTINGKTACRYCGREGRVSALLSEIGWLPENLTFDRPEDFQYASELKATGTFITTGKWVVPDGEC